MSSTSTPFDQDALLRELGALPAIHSILNVVCKMTGMGFAAVAHVSESRWVACQVRDEVGFGLPAGGELPIKSTLCDSVRGSGQAIAIDEVSKDPLYSDHHTPRIYGLQSYIAVPIWLSEGAFFGTLCAIDARPRNVDTPEIRGMFDLFAQLIATHFDRIRAVAETQTLSRSVIEAEAAKKVYADIVESSTAAVTALGLDWRILAINHANVEAFELVFGVRPKVGDRFLAPFENAPAQLEQLRGYWARALAGETFAVVDEFGDNDHERRFYEVRFTPLLSADGTRIGASSTAYDVTARVEAERQLAAAQEQLRQSQKMEALGQLTGGVAHDFNNLLTPIVGALDMLQRRGLGGEREQRLIQGAALSAERAKTLVQRLLAFARRQPLQPVAVDLGQLVHNMVGLIESTTGPQIRVVVDVAAGLEPAKADANQLEMALLNLAVNARDAMPQGGTLQIEADKVDVGTLGPPGLVAGPYVKLTVADTGIGMDDETLARAVEPFFSTKGVGKGTGLGLSMVHGLAAQLGGALQIRSEPGKGTVVALWLPVSGPTDACAPEVRSPDIMTATADRGIALLVDDEELVRISTADMLVELGFKVIETSSAEAALQAIELGSAPDLLVTNHLMPGLSGAELAARARVSHPALPVVIVSGYADIQGVPPEFPRLTKPFRKSELAAIISGLGRS